MKCNPSSNSARISARRRRAGFTLAEMLAALALMSIVIPVAVNAIRVASLAGQVAERRAVAMRIADRVLNEVLVTEQANQGALSGTMQEGDRSFDWTMQTQQWSEDEMTLVTVSVVFQVQGQDYDVQLSTLADLTETTTTDSTGSTTGTTTQ
jgi:type II secretion system protein I